MPKDPLPPLGREYACPHWPKVCALAWVTIDGPFPHPGKPDVLMRWGHECDPQAVEHSLTFAERWEAERFEARLREQPLQRALPLKFPTPRRTEGGGTVHGGPGRRYAWHYARKAGPPARTE